MQGADEIAHDLTITVHVPGRAHEPHIAANPGKILPQLRKHALGRAFVVIEIVIAKRVAQRGGQDRAICKLSAHRERGFPIQKADVERAYPERASIDRSVRRQDAVIQILRERNFLARQRIPHLKREIFPQGESEARGPSYGRRRVRDIARRELLLAEKINSECYAVSEKIRLDERQLESARILSILHGCLAANRPRPNRFLSEMLTSARNPSAVEQP
jgi:hypothetical protein